MFTLYTDDVKFKQIERVELHNIYFAGFDEYLIDFIKWQNLIELKNSVSLIELKCRRFFLLAYALDCVTWAGLML